MRTSTLVTILVLYAARAHAQHDCTRVPAGVMTQARSLSAPLYDLHLRCGEPMQFSHQCMADQAQFTGGLPKMYAGDELSVALDCVEAEIRRKALADRATAQKAEAEARKLDLRRKATTFAQLVISREFCLSRTAMREAMDVLEEQKQSVKLAGTAGERTKDSMVEVAAAIARNRDDAQYWERLMRERYHGEPLSCGRVDELFNCNSKQCIDRSNLVAGILAEASDIIEGKEPPAPDSEPTLFEWPDRSIHTEPAPKQKRSASKPAR